MEKKQFQAESKRLLQMMIHSIYTNKDIFLRELISNASDALDKRHYTSLTSHDATDVPYTITIAKDETTLTIADTGIGMNKEELENNLGTIAKSGSSEFKEMIDKKEDIDIIGQFGVGFYAAFMVADKVRVESKKIGSETAYVWESTGDEGYTIEECDKQSIGTTITLTLKKDTDEENYSHYLQDYTIKELVKKYSDYVRYPIQMDVMHTEQKDDNTSETKIVRETLNSMKPLWKRNKSEISEEDYNNFYKTKFMDFADPQKVLHYNVEGNISYTALLFIPSATPYNFYYADYEPGLQLYSKGVFIMDKAKDLIPDYYRFVNGIIDSEDISLNISREILQQDRQVKAIAKSVETKIHGLLAGMLKDERSEYEKFFDNFGLNLKYGIYKDYGINQDKLKDLLLFKSSYKDTYVTLEEYTSRMKEDQKEIYYVVGSSIEEIKRNPILPRLFEKEYEVLYFLDERDEFVSGILAKFNDKPFRNITKGDLDLDSEEEKKAKEEKTNENKDLLAALKDALEGKVKEVRISSRLVNDPVIVVADEGLSLEMEKFMQNDPQSKGIKADKILELNPDHPLFTVLQETFKTNPAQLKEDAYVLYDQAMLMQGLPIENPTLYARRITNLLLRANGKETLSVD